MSFYRYLLHISYMGKPFKGAQRQVRGGFPRIDDPNTVQGRIEMALKILNPANMPVVYLSSRTDSGVSALNSSLHVDLSRYDSTVYKPKTITLCLNKYFNKEEIPIRVLKTYLVPNEFNSRHNAVCRTYLYRFAVRKRPSEKYERHLYHIPIEELERCYFMTSDTFDVSAMREAAKLFVGCHDFRTFMGKGSQDLDRMTRRIVVNVEVLEGKRPFYSSYSWPSFIDSQVDDYQFFDVYIKAKGFLYRQVRRMVASLLTVAQAGKMVGTRVYVGGLPYGTTERDLERFFRGYGHMRDVLIKNGYGFVEFDDNRDADDAVYELNGKKLLGERVTVERARGTPRGRDQWSGRSNNTSSSSSDHRSHERYGPPTRTNYRVIVENLSSRISWQDLKDYMRQAGEVTYADAHKQHRNEGVVEFASHTDMKNAVDKLDDTELNGRRIRVVEDRKRGRSGSYSSRSRSRSAKRSRSRRSSRSDKDARDSRSNSRKKSVDRSRSRSRDKSVERRSRSRSVHEKRSKSREQSKGRSRSRSN